MKAGLDRKRELGMACTRQECSGGTGNDAQGEEAAWMASFDAREAVESAAMRTDSRMPMSLFDDVSVVSDLSEDDVVYVGSYFSLRRAMLVWVAVVFYTSILGYDKAVVIK